MEQGLTIHYSPEDMAELYEFIQWKTKKAAGNFVTIDDTNFDLLRDATGLIKKAQQEKQNILRQIEAQRGSQQELDQQRADVSLLPDREAERIQSEWAKEAAQQAESYAVAINSGKRWRSGEDKDIRDGVLSWLKRQKLRGNFGGRKAFDKN